jgi:transcriptional regulator with XRE-family HTH domain
VPVSGDRPYASVGELIKTRRLARGFNSQKALAAALGDPITREYVSRWENDHYTPGPKHATALARVLGGEPAEYRGLSGEPRNLRDLVTDLMERVERLERRVRS